MNSENDRYFIALLPPDNVQQEIQIFKRIFQTQYGSKAALKSPPHVTLQPPFLWPRQVKPQLHQTLMAFAAHTQPIPMELSGFGAFRPRVIYVDVIKTPELMAVQPALMECLAVKLGIINKQYSQRSGAVPSRQRPFAPHVTVAFRDLKPATFRLAWPDFEHRPYHASFVVPELTLLIHDGQRWQVDAHFCFKS